QDPNPEGARSSLGGHSSFSRAERDLAHLDEEINAKHSGSALNWSRSNVGLRGTHFVFVVGRRFLRFFAKGISTAAAAFNNRRKVSASFVRGRRRGRITSMLRRQG